MRQRSVARGSKSSASHNSTRSAPTVQIWVGGHAVVLLSFFRGSSNLCCSHGMGRHLVFIRK